ncbi:hypothetical protein GDO78_020097 [Eleutherodactylus coqui]|uniref:Ig-like domain-containing protein n=1 Tax=Eleutherodactylus coqui TaxID=57060 RepID=A0A8J6EHX2_ELECQ|nr:hypothetical protein GDO78_020097 [Eleutherodactylus coqui]
MAPQQDCATTPQSRLSRREHYKSPQEPAVTVLATSKEVVKDIGSATLLCSLQNFFPEAIQVMWTEVGRSEELKSEQGELVKDASTNMSSLYSWITIRQTDIGKIFRCKYKHEGNGNRWREVEYNTASLKDTNQYEITNSSCMDTADLTDGVDVGPMIVVRAAQLIYALLLLKCLLYCPFLLLFRYKSSK